MLKSVQVQIMEVVIGWVKILAVFHLKSSRLFQRPGSKKKLCTSVECLSVLGFVRPSTEYHLHQKRPQSQSFEPFSLGFEARGLLAIVLGLDVAFSS